MAEVVGLVVGLVPIAANLIGGIDKLREIRQRSTKAPADLNFLLQELKFLELVLHQAGSTPHFNHLPRVQHCKASCQAVAKGIEDLLEKLPSASNLDERKPKWKETWGLRHWKQDVDELKRNVEKAKQELSLILSLHNLLKGSQCRSIINRGSTRITPPSKPSPGDLMKFQGVSMAQRQWDCSARACSCSCHRTSIISRRFWALEYSGPGFFNQTCDQASCTSSSYGLRLRLALSQLGIPWSVIMSFHVLASVGSYGIRPALQIEHVVRYTSPGFEILYKLRWERISVQTACDDFRKLAQTDRSLRHHVDPSGSSYIDVVMDILHPYIGGSDRFDLLAVLICELQISRGLEKKSFLGSFARSATTPQHMVLLDTITKYGFDPTTIDSPRLSEWPKPCLLRPFEPTITNPFYIDILTVVCKNNQGFAGMTPLHEAVLFQSPDMARHWCDRSGNDEKNVLGQTPLHLAVSQPEHLKIIIDAGHDLDAIDAYGITPLMYAAALNQIRAVQTLLCAGANPSIQDSRFSRTFIYYAAICGNWQLIIVALRQIKMAMTEAIADVLAREALVFYFTTAHFHSNPNVPFGQILAHCRSPHFLVTDPIIQTKGNTLLHFAQSARDVDILLSHGFENINHTNDAGRHALMMSAAYSPNSPSPEVITRLLDGGADANLQDKEGHTIIHILTQRLSGQKIEKRDFLLTLDSLHAAVVRGADGLIPDHCRCACSVSGCLPATILSSPALNRGHKRLPIICFLEWIIMVLESQGLDPARETVLAFIRGVEHQELGMTHLCCRAPAYTFADTSTSSTTREDDIDEILEEESDFSRILDKKMKDLSRKELGSLIKFAILYDKSLFDRSMKDAARKEKGGQTGFFSTVDVDHKNDQFVNRYSGFIMPDPALEITADIPNYAGWMERRFRIQDNCEPSFCKEQYFRRLSWLYYIGDLYGISVADIIQEMENPNPRGLANSVSPEEDQDIRHFRKSWETWSAQGPAIRNISTVGFANWPFIEADEQTVGLNMSVLSHFI